MRKIAVIIGASDGIGKQLSIDLNKIGYAIIAIGRNMNKLNDLKKRLSYDSETISADVSLLSVTEKVANEIIEKYNKIDLVIHTADVLLTKRQETSEGNELTFATNYLSRVLFNAILINSLKNSTAPHIIHVAAAGMPFKLNLQDFPLPKTASSFKGHTVGQLANDYYGIMFAKKHQTIKINVLNPGMVNTNIRKKTEANLLVRLAIKMMERIIRPTSLDVYSQLVIDIITGKNHESVDAILINSKGKGIKLSKQLQNETIQKHVWEQTKQLINI